MVPPACGHVAEQAPHRDGGEVGLVHERAAGVGVEPAQHVPSPDRGAKPSALAANPLARRNVAPPGDAANSPSM